MDKITDFIGDQPGYPEAFKLPEYVDEKEFENKDAALEYYNGLHDNDEVYGNLNPESYQQFIVSTDNFANFLKEKKLDEYLEFFSKFYK